MDSGLWFYTGMADEKRTEESQESADMVKPYAPPSLQRIGSLEELTHTQSKGGTSGDGGFASRM